MPWRCDIKTRAKLPPTNLNKIQVLRTLGIVAEQCYACLLHGTQRTIFPQTPLLVLNEKSPETGNAPTKALFHPLGKVSLDDGNVNDSGQCDMFGENGEWSTEAKETLNCVPGSCWVIVVISNENTCISLKTSLCLIFGTQTIKIMDQS